MQALFGAVVRSPLLPPLSLHLHTPPLPLPPQQNAYDHSLRGTYLFINVPPLHRSPGALAQDPAARATYAQHIAAYNAALEGARSTLHLAPVHELLEEWRCRAVLQADPEAFRRSVRRAAEFFTGEAVPDDEPFAVTRAHAGM